MYDGRRMVPTSDKSTNAILGGAAFHTSERKRNTAPAMSEIGQKRRFGNVRIISALPPEADIHHKGRHVSKVPRRDIEHASARKEKPPVGGFSIQTDDLGSGGHQRCLCLPAMSHEADASEAKDHHRAG
jgi:hypothetical protein